MDDSNTLPLSVVLQSAPVVEAVTVAVIPTAVTLATRAVPGTIHSNLRPEISLVLYSLNSLYAPLSLLFFTKIVLAHGS